MILHVATIFALESRRVVASEKFWNACCAFRAEIENVALHWLTLYDVAFWTELYHCVATFPAIALIITDLLGVKLWCKKQSTKSIPALSVHWGWPPYRAVFAFINFLLLLDNKLVLRFLKTISTVFKYTKIGSLATYCKTACINYSLQREVEGNRLVKSWFHT